MTRLRQRMLEDMQIRNFSAGTQCSYIHYIADFAKRFDNSPDRLGLDDVRNHCLIPQPDCRLKIEPSVSLCRRNGTALTQSRRRRERDVRIARGRVRLVGSS